DDGVHGVEPWILGPVQASASTASLLAPSSSVVPGPVADLPLSEGVGDLPAAILWDRYPAGVASVGSFLQQHALLEETFTPGTHVSESAGRSPAVLRPKSQPPR